MHYSSQPIAPAGGKDNGSGNSNGSGSGNGSTITLRTCKMCYDQVTARQQKQQKKLKTAEEAAAASASASETADRKRKQGISSSNNNNNVNNNNSSGGVDAVTPKRGTAATTTASTASTTLLSSMPHAAKSSPQIDVFSSRLRDFQIHSADIGFEESSAYLRQWSKAIGAEGITSLATKAAGLVRDELPTTDGGAPPQGLSAKQRQTSRSSSTSSGAAGDPDRSGIVEEGNRHLGETAASHLEQMTASLLESDAPLLWRKVGEEQAIATATGVVTSSGTSNNENDIEKLRAQWVNKLMSLATRCCATVDTNIKRGDMLDIRPYVKIKGRIII
jgi:urease accessory protein UreF